MADLTIPRGDKGFRLSFTVKDADGDAYTLTGYTINMKVWRKGNSGTVLLTATCTIDEAASGTCYYDTQAADFTTTCPEGDYVIELELTKTGYIESTRIYTLRVEESA